MSTPIRQPDAPTETARSPHPRPPESAADLLGRLSREVADLARFYLRAERPDHTLQPTALVNEVWLRIAGREDLRFESKEEFIAYVSTAMRSILVDSARRREADRRGGGRLRCSLEVDHLLIESVDGSNDVGHSLVELDEELTLLAKSDPVSARAFELRYFGGMSCKQAAERLGLSTRRIQDYTEAARCWLRDRLDDRRPRREP